MLLPLNLSAWTVQVQVLVKAKRWDFAVRSRMVTAISAGAVTSARGPRVCSPVPRRLDTWLSRARHVFSFALAACGKLSVFQADGASTARMRRARPPVRRTGGRW